jgi:hypothetical protein
VVVVVELDVVVVGRRPGLDAASTTDLAGMQPATSKQIASPVAVGAPRRTLSVWFMCVDRRFPGRAGAEPAG